MRKWFKRIVVLIIAVLFLTVSYFILDGYSLYRKAVEEIGIYDKVDGIMSEERYTVLEELPPIYLKAVVSVEDHRFYDHFGIDMASIARAILTNIKTMSFAEGGSTITQQLAKNIYFTQDKEIRRKIAEAFMAIYMENHLEKDVILELYVNTIYFGNGYYCIRDASEGYFNKHPKYLTDYESTLLAGIPNAPSVYALTANPDLAERRRLQVINKMITYGGLNEEDAEKIKEDR